MVPAFIQAHWHCADERLHTSRTLVVGSSESTTHTLVIQYLDLEGEVFLQVLNDHDQERKLDGQGLLWVKRGVDVVRGHVSSHDFEN